MMGWRMLSGISLCVQFGRFRDCTLSLEAGAVLLNASAVLVGLLWRFDTLDF
jgi:hypothetical protein